MRLLLHLESIRRKLSESENYSYLYSISHPYKQWGYNYFFDASYFTKQDDTNSFQYGLNDKIILSPRPRAAKTPHLDAGFDAGLDAGPSA